MDVALALLADFANQSVDGKLNVLGVFDTIYAAQYPAVHPEMKLVIRFRLHPAELEEPPKRIQIQLRDDQGKKVAELGGEIKVVLPEGGPPSGEMVSSDFILGINGLPLEHPGSYEFVVLVNSDVKASVPLKAAQR
jgi:hypothetical protein